MKRLLGTFAALLIIASGISQQTTTFSQYMLNPYIINPAAAGIDNETSVFLHYRKQWMGFSNSPRTFALTLATPMKDNKYGLGFQFFSDEAHILSNNSGRVSYRYTLDLNEEHRLGFGLYGGFMQRKVRYSEIQNADLEDPTLFRNDVSGTVFDAGFGAWYTWKTLEAGLSIDQMLNNKFKFSDDITGSEATFQNLRHFTLNAAYDYKFKDEVWAVKPGVALRSFQGANINFEGTVIGTWKDMLWAGAGYRQGFGVIFLAGVEIMEQLTFGYSYDYSTGDIKNYTTGSHEVLLSYRFAKGNADEDANTQRRLRRQASEIRDLKAQNEEMRAELDQQKEEIERLKAVEDRDAEEMQKVINENKVETIPEKGSDGEPTEGSGTSAEGTESNDVGGAAVVAGSVASSKEVEELKEQVEGLQKEMEALKSGQTKVESSDNGELEEKINKLEEEIEVLKTGKVVNADDSNTDPSIDKYYVVTGAYFNVEDAKLLQKILKREMNMDTRVVSRADRKFFFVVSKEVSTNDEAQAEMKRLKESGIGKYINGNTWIYGSGK